MPNNHMVVISDIVEKVAFCYQINSDKTLFYVYVRSRWNLSKWFLMSSECLLKPDKMGFGLSHAREAGWSKDFTDIPADSNHL